MNQKMTRERWEQLKRLELDFWALAERARRLGKKATDLRTLAEMGDLDSWSRSAPDPMMGYLADVSPYTPFELYDMAAKALRWLEECRDEEASELGDEVRWLLPQVGFMRYDDGQEKVQYSPNGSKIGITRTWVADELASQCRAGCVKAHKLAEKAAAEVMKQERDDAAQARTKAEKERDDAEIRAHVNIKGQLSEVLGKEILPELKKGLKAAEGAEAEAKKAHQGIQRLIGPAEAIFKKSAQGLIKWLRRHDKRQKYPDEMKREVMEEVRHKREVYIPPNVPDICKKVLKKHGYLCDGMPKDEQTRCIQNFQRAYERFAIKSKNIRH